MASASVIDRLGRKILLIVSATVMSVTISGLGAYFYIQQVDPSTALKISFLPVSCLCIYLVAFSLAFGAIPWLMMSELMAPEIKSLSNTIACKFRGLFPRIVFLILHLLFFSRFKLGDGFSSDKILHRCITGSGSRANILGVWWFYVGDTNWCRPFRT